MITYCACYRGKIHSGQKGLDENPAIQSRQRGAAQFHAAPLDVSAQSPLNFVIFAAEWLEVRAKVGETPGGEGSNDDCEARNYNAMYYGKKGYG
jgi:hypothetical protein